jgi:hypothetical protein
VYQAARREVTSVAVNSAGVIYAAAIGSKSGLGQSTSPSSLSIPPPAIRTTQANSGGGAPPGGQIQLSPAPPPLPSSPPAIAGGSEVYRIAVDNSPQRIWTHAQDIVYAIGLDAQGHAVLGTGNKGNIYRIDSDLVSTLLINASPTQVTAFAAGPKGGLYAATGNVGKVYQIGPDLQKSGSYESEAMDAQSFSYWGRIRWKGEANPTGVRIETRSGNLDRPQNNWSAWTPLDGAGRVASPPHGFCSTASP